MELPITREGLSMPYKPIDFQISIPRTPESGGQQSRLNHRALTEQSMLEQDTMKQSEQLRTRNTAVEQSGNHGITSNRNKDSSASSKRKRKKEGQEDISSEQQADSGQAAHPFKGKHIDFSF
ncbi:hypothetical protein GZH47_03785 [Paenibacillus rhizovicinus]|uniref:RNA polymerase subunit sigma n=1 Tax=Paenibacillus rhizovicinus TaxID=2704463 RepID=A0A6C0NV98_9BACL|nr:hypothetical protein [Paenibacillus rhizovicinus]QHW30041.1 hypothetical protein GZH47_03785 [Paenibacillus rhizovicinus]